MKEPSPRSSTCAPTTVEGQDDAERPLVDGLRAQFVDGLTTFRHPRSWSRRGIAFAVLGVSYVALTLLIVFPGTPVLHLDSYLRSLRLSHRYPGWHTWVSTLVGFGQRWIMTYVLQLIVLWAALRARSIRPIVQFATAIILLNVSVGVVKYALGRIGPMHQANAHDIFVFGGNIFPSGHVSNAVVLYGVIAWAMPKYRRTLVTIATAICVIVGLGTIYLRTHWFSDVIGGWIAGSMVLLAMPSVMPWTMRFGHQFVAWLRAVLAERPALQRRAHGVLAFARRVVPADPRYWGRHGRPVDRVLPGRRIHASVVPAPVDQVPGDQPVTATQHGPATRLKGHARPAAHAEFADWPTAETEAREVYSS